MLIAPSYYPQFACIADRCRHTCCAGWEIDIDDESCACYQAMPGPMGERLRSVITPGEDGEPAHFCLTADERCPLLNERGLCDLITACGESALCQVCADHPRFRSFFSDRTEIGLGLCCEAAARLVLTQTEPLRLIQLSSTDDDAPTQPDPEEAALLALRERLLTLLSDRTQSLKVRLTNIAATVGAALPQPTPADMAALFLSLERLDDVWTKRLETLAVAKPLPAPDAQWDLPLEQLTAYLLYRHLPGALDDGCAAERVLMCLLLVQLASALFALAGCKSMDELCEIARLLSSEIEYSQENIDALLDACAQY